MPDGQIPTLPNPQIDPDEDDGKTGFALHREKLHCLIALNDGLAEALSSKAGNAFLRAFIVENRQTGDVHMNFRFRYKDGDSWFRVNLNEEHQNWPLVKKIEHLADGMEQTQRMALTMMAGAMVTPPMEAITRWYPPNPDDAQATLDWLIAQDLVEMTFVQTPEGLRTPVGKASETLT